MQFWQIKDLYPAAKSLKTPLFGRIYTLYLAEKHQNTYIRQNIYIIFCRIKHFLYLCGKI